jgi:hypothetical protein
MPYAHESIYTYVCNAKTNGLETISRIDGPIRCEPLRCPTRGLAAGYLAGGNTNVLYPSRYVGYAIFNQGSRMSNESS